MINTTDRLVFVRTSAKSIHRGVKQSIRFASKQMRERLNHASVREADALAFERLLDAKNIRTNKQFDVRFLEAAFGLTVANQLGNASASSELRTISDYLHSATLSAVGIQTVRAGFKLVLVDLWRQGILLLPTTFIAGPGFQSHLFENELLEWMLAFDPNDSKIGGGKTDARRMHWQGPRVLWASTWKRVEDVSILDIADLHRAQLRYSRGAHPHRIAGSQFPFLLLAAELAASFPERVSFSADDIAKYSTWSTADEIFNIPLREFSQEEPGTRSRYRTIRIKVIETTATSTEAEAPTSPAFAEQPRDSIHAAVLVALKKHASKRTGPLDWRDHVPRYSSREHIDISELSKVWIDCFRAYLHYRTEVEGFRTDKDVFSALNILADYLFFYLPWWKELFPATKLSVPFTPKDFIRYSFVFRTTTESLEVFPMTLMDLISLRRPSKDSAYVAIQQLSRFFRFIEVNYHDDEQVAGPNFRNPIDPEFDLPKLKRRSKTTKAVIPKSMFGHLLFYCYAVESFGEHLLQQALAGTLEASQPALSQSLRFDCDALGFRPRFRYRDREFSLDSAPNLFSWHKRKLVRNGVQTEVLVPHLSSFRLLITSLETGLRCQSVQWLDRETWDTLNEGKPEGYCYELLVNTDKTKTEPWIAPMVFRVRELLTREASFQRLFLDADQFSPVHYEGLEASPFGLIRPLFRSPSTGKPLADAIYYRTWSDLIVDFEGFFRSATDESHIKLYKLRPVRTKDGQPVIRFTDQKSFPFCPLTIETEFTPHSCRATFATNHQAGGIMDLSDCAESLGHADEIVTSHYTKFSIEQLMSRLQGSDNLLLGDYELMDTASNSKVRADKPTSALVQGFMRDRAGTIKTFRFMPSISLWSTTDVASAHAEGLELLRSGPMSHIRFRETHICPVGEECPLDIIKAIGARRRCGMCPLAMKCVDHLDGISAKIRELKERIRYLHTKKKSLIDAGEPQTVLDEVWEELQLDINELAGWELSERVLAEDLKRAIEEPEQPSMYRVERPDFVKLHLSRITRTCTEAEFLLIRMADVAAFPSMDSARVQATAAMVRRQISAGQGLDAFVDSSGQDRNLSGVVSSLCSIMRAKSLSLSEIASHLKPAIGLRPSPQLISTTP